MNFKQFKALHENPISTTVTPNVSSGVIKPGDTLTGQDGKLKSKVETKRDENGKTIYTMVDPTTGQKTEYVSDLKPGEEATEKRPVLSKVYKVT